jgi:ferredoxin--NADP+ reductase
MPPSSSLRVAIVGAGPAGFFLAEQLARAEGLDVSIDLLDRLPSPFGLVRTGVAPDHQKIKAVAAAFERTALRPNVRFFGNVTVGDALTIEALAAHYHQIVFCTGAETDRALDIPGEVLAGSHSATSFVGWYNGHPDYRDAAFDLSHPRAIVVGMGNVAVDVCRILCRTPEELASTDIADHALEALRRSRVREVVMVGRRGPAEAAFTAAEAEELLELADADVRVELPLASRSLLEAPGVDRASAKKLAALRKIAARRPLGRGHALTLRFLASPTELVDRGDGHVGAVRLVDNELAAGPDGSVRARPTATRHVLQAGLVLRSIGYRGVAIPGVPFDARRGVIPSEGGRVVDEDGRALPGHYVAGWIKRGPSGVIGTNKADAQATASAMVEDARVGAVLQPSLPSLADAERTIRRAHRDAFSYRDWLVIDALETSRGQATGRPRAKLTRISDMLAALDHSTGR